MNFETIFKLTEKTLSRIKILAEEGATTDGDHHKQWYFSQILDELGCNDLEEDEKGVAP